MHPKHHLRKAVGAVRAALADLPSTSPVAFGCSGGADSMALAAALRAAYPGARAKQVQAVLVDHGLQEVTQEVTASTATLLQAWGFTVHLKQVTVAPGASLEAQAREARYAAFQEVLEDTSSPVLLLGHTLHDQAEQVLLGLLRGSGLRSLAGMPQVRGPYRRPFLTALTRDETEAVCREASLSFWQDPHNEDTSFRRVAARRLLQDLEETWGQPLVPSLARTASLAAADAEALETWAAREAPLLREAGWPVEGLLALPQAVRSRALRRELMRLGAPGEQVTWEKLARMEAFLTSWHGQGPLQVTQGLQVARRGNHIVFLAET